MLYFPWRFVLTVFYDVFQILRVFFTLFAVQTQSDLQSFVN